MYLLYMYKPSLDLYVSVSCCLRVAIVEGIPMDQRLDLTDTRVFIQQSPDKHINCTQATSISVTVTLIESASWTSAELHQSLLFYTIYF